MTPDPYAALDAEEARLLAELAEVRSAKATLRRVLGLADPPHGPVGLPAEEPAGKPEPAPEMPTGRVLEIVRALADHGPLPNARMAALLGLSSGRVSTIIGLHDHLFEKLPGNRQALWALSPAGRAVAAALPPGA